jgi:hypothetical protein
MGKYDFVCKSESGEDLCFNGGICAQDNVTYLEYCICPEGWGADRVLFHQRNVRNELEIKFSVVFVTNKMDIYSAHYPQTYYSGSSSAYSLFLCHAYFYYSAFNIKLKGRQEQCCGKRCLS